MNSNGQILAAIRQITLGLGELSLPDDANELVELVLQQQKLLEAYIRSAGAEEIDRELIQEVLVEHEKLLSRTRLAHSEVSKELGVLTQGRSAISAYRVVEERQYAD